MSGQVGNLEDRFCHIAANIWVKNIFPQESKSGKGDTGSGWMMNRTQDGHKFFFNTKSMDYTWSRTDDVIKDHSLLTKEEIQVGFILSHSLVWSVCCT